VPRRPLVGAIALSTTLGLTASFLIALAVWHGFGAEAHTDPWRTSQGRVPFDSLVNLLRNPQGPDWPGIGGLVFGDRFEIELHDPVLGRALRHACDVEVLPRGVQ